jgi:nucleotide-binding universal stress UspA family protein
MASSDRTVAPFHEITSNLTTSVVEPIKCQARCSLPFLTTSDQTASASVRLKSEKEDEIDQRDLSPREHTCDVLIEVTKLSSKRERCKMPSDFVVHIPIDRSSEQIIDCAVSVASSFDAHLDGIACVYQSLDSVIAFEASAAAVAGATEYDTGVELAAAALDQFEIAARRAGISHGIRTVCNSPYSASQTLAETSRLYDLSMVAQPNGARPSPNDLLPEAVLFNSGRPMLMVPYIHVGPLKLERVLICWDGGRPAARAVHDAMPFLHNAKVIDVVTVNGDDSMVSEVSAAALIVHLARHDISAGVQQPTADASDIHNAILSLAADKSSDLIVMGGYGHSRLREFILGGVTRGMFESLTVPALISH